jgi:hypothetical protein
MKGVVLVWHYIRSPYMQYVLLHYNGTSVLIQWGMASVSARLYSCAVVHAAYSGLCERRAPFLSPVALRILSVLELCTPASLISCLLGVGLAAFCHLADTPLLRLYPLFPSLTDSYVLSQ